MIILEFSISMHSVTYKLIYMNINTFNGKTKFIEELYNGYIVAEYDKKYRFKLYNNRVGDEINNKHLIIKNY